MHAKTSGGLALAATLALSLSAAPASASPVIDRQVPIPLDDEPDAQERDANRPSIIAPACPPASVDETPPARQARAERNVANAEAWYVSGDYELALKAVDAAECAEPDPAHEFMRGVIHAARGDCERTGEHMRRFLEHGPEKMDIHAAVTVIEECRDRPGPVRAPPIPDLDMGPSTPPPPRPVTRPSAPPPLGDRPAVVWYRDPAGGVLLGLGSASVATGIGLLIGARAVALRQAETAGEFESDRVTARRLRAGGATMLGIGSAALVGALVRYVLVHRRGRGGGRSTAAR